MPDINELDLSVLLSLPPAEAVKYMQGKGFTFTWDWREQLAVNHSQAFTVAKAMKLDILQDMKDGIDLSLKEGLSFKDFQKELEPKLKARGWWGKQVVDGKVVQLGSPHRLKTIYDTNIQSALNAGRWEGQVANKINRPFLEFVAILDAATRPGHAALNGTIKPLDSPFWQTYYPPLGFRCRCRTRSLTFKQMRKRGGLTDGTPKLSNAVPEMKKLGISTTKVKKLKGLDKTVKPDEGFSNHPATPWKPDKKDYDSDIWNAGKKLKQ